VPERAVPEQQPTPRGDRAGMESGDTTAPAPVAIRGPGPQPVLPRTVLAVQRLAGNRAARSLAGRPAVQRDLLDFMMRNPALATVVNDLHTAYAQLREAGRRPDLSEHGAGLLQAVDSAWRATERADYSPTSLLRWARAIQQALGPLTVRADGRRVAELVGSLIRQPGMRQTVETDMSAREQAAADRRREQLGEELRAYLRRHWASVRSAPSIHRVRISELIRRALGSREAAEAYVRGAEGPMGRFLRLLWRNPRAVQRNQDNILRAVVLAIGGEWADIVVPEQAAESGDADRREAAELTGDTETSTEAEVVGIGVDTFLTLWPGLDQIGDVRDFAAHIYALLDLDGRRPQEVSNPWRWIGVALSGLGVIPTVGSILKGAGRIIMRFVGPGSAVARLAQRVVGQVADLIRRVDPRVVEFVQRLLNGLRTRWSAWMGRARRKWDDIAEEVRRVLDGIAVGMTAFGRRARRRWRGVVAAGGRRLSAAFDTLEARLPDAFAQVLASLRRRGAAVAEDLADAARRVRRRIDDLRYELMGADRRMEQMQDVLDQLDDVGLRLRRAVEAGDDAAVGELTQEAMGLLASAERRMHRYAGAHAPAVPGRPAPGGRDAGAGVVPVQAPSAPDNPLRGRPGTALSPEVLERNAGMRPEVQTRFQDTVERHGIAIDVRPTNPQAPALRRAGHLPKPEYIKAKSINELDLELGWRPEDLGLVGYRRPTRPPRPEGMTDADWASSPVMRRYRQRVQEFEDRAHEMAQLQLPPHAREPHYRNDAPYAAAPQLQVDQQGVIRIRGQVAEGGAPAGFTGDHDVFDIRNADGSPLDPVRYEQIAEELQAAGMDVLHGAHLRWRPGSSTERGIDRTIRRGHQQGGEAVIRFSPSAPPVTANYVPPPDLPVDARPLVRPGRQLVRRGLRPGSHRPGEESETAAGR
jgi:hypothetical protein